MTSNISPAIIMRVRELGESDLLVSFFTPDKGLLRGIAKGARRSLKRFANCLNLFCLTSMEYELRRKGGLYFLDSCKLLSAFPALRSDFSSLSLASYMVELTEILFPPGVVDRRMFELLKSAFFDLNEGKRLDVLRILFEAKVMALGGYGIGFDKCCECGRPYTGKGRSVFKRIKGGIACLKCEQESTLSPGLSPDAVRGINTMQSAPWGKVKELLLTDQIMKEIRQVLELHIEYRIGQRLKSAEFLK